MPPPKQEDVENYDNKKCFVCGRGTSKGWMFSPDGDSTKEERVWVCTGRTGDAGVKHKEKKKDMLLKEGKSFVTWDKKTGGTIPKANHPSKLTVAGAPSEAATWDGMEQEHGYAPQAVEYHQQQQPNSIAAADLGGDGDLDHDLLLATLIRSGRELINAGNGTFPTSIELPGALPTSFRLGFDTPGSTDSDWDSLQDLQGLLNSVSEDPRGSVPQSPVTSAQQNSSPSALPSCSGYPSHDPHTQSFTVLHSPSQSDPLAADEPLARSKRPRPDFLSRLEHCISRAPEESDEEYTRRCAALHRQFQLVATYLGSVAAGPFGPCPDASTQTAQFDALQQQVEAAAVSDGVELPFALRSLPSQSPSQSQAAGHDDVDIHQQMLHVMLGALSLTAQPAAVAPAASSSTHVDFLFVVCSPKVSPLPQASIEAHANAACVERAGLTALVHSNGNLTELNTIILHRQPRVIVFAGHADASHPSSKRTLGLTDASGNLIIMEPDTIARIFSQPSERLELVSLNGCCSSELCEAITRRFSLPTCGWSSRTADAAAKAHSLGLVDVLVQRMKARPAAGRLTSGDLNAAFNNAERSVLAAVASGGTSKWALVDPDGCVDHMTPDGKWAAGVPVQLVPLPPSKLLSNLGSFPSLPSHYVPREEEERLCAALLARAAPMFALSGARAATSSVAGVAGLGKTTIMTWLGRSVRVQTVFSDGICWLAFGQERDAFGRMRELAEMLGMPRDEIKELRDVTDAARQLQPRLKGKRMLLMLDDVWRLEQAKPFKGLASEGVSVLLTTRKGEIVDFCGEQLLPLGPMADAVALRVLVESSGKTEAALRGAEPEALVALLKKCSGLPAMLRSVGRRCSRQEVGAVLLFLETHKLKHKVPTSLEAAEGYGNLFVMLEGQLDDIEQHQDKQLAGRCTMLAALPEDTPVPLDVLQLLWGLGKAGTQQRVDLLAKRHLVEPSADGKGIAPLLDVVRDYLACRAKSELKGWHAAMVRGWMEGCGEVLTRQEGEYWWKSLGHHITGAGGAVTIPASVISISGGAFAACSGLTSVAIPASVTSIGRFAFQGCICLTSVTIPASVTSIGNWAFSYCSGLISVTIPDSVTSIGYDAFFGCTGLTSVIIPASVTSINGCFHGCSGLTSVNIPASVISIGGGAFLGCSGLTSVTIPASVTSIGDEAFRGCTGLTSITIPASVTSIGRSAFLGCSGLTVTVASVTLDLIGIDAFSGCTVLTPAPAANGNARSWWTSMIESLTAPRMRK